MPGPALPPVVFLIAHRAALLPLQMIPKHGDSPK